MVVGDPIKYTHDNITITVSSPVTSITFPVAGMGGTVASKNQFDVVGQTA